MLINSDYSQRVLLRHQDLPWAASPEAGVDRRMLDRTGGEVVDTGRAPWHQGMVPGLSVMPLMSQGAGSTLVRWAPATRFSTHRHYGGEEILVVRGVFADEHGTSSRDGCAGRVKK